MRFYTLGSVDCTGLYTQMFFTFNRNYKTTYYFG